LSGRMTPVTPATATHRPPKHRTEGNVAAVEERRADILIGDVEAGLGSVLGRRDDEVEHYRQPGEKDVDQDEVGHGQSPVTTDLGQAENRPAEEPSAGQRVRNFHHAGLAFATSRWHRSSRRRYRA